MSDEFQKQKHTLYSCNRESLEMSGVKEVDAFNEEEVRAQSDYGEIIIKGSALHVEALDLEAGSLKVSGKISAVVYSDRIVKRGALGRLFS